MRKKILTILWIIQITLVIITIFLLVDGCNKSTVEGKKHLGKVYNVAGDTVRIIGYKPFSRWYIIDGTIDGVPFNNLPYDYINVWDKKGYEIDSTIWYKVTPVKKWQDLLNK